MPSGARWSHCPPSIQRRRGVLPPQSRDDRPRQAKRAASKTRGSKHPPPKSRDPAGPALLCAAVLYSCAIHPTPIRPAKMPRDLLADKQTLESMPQLSREPQARSPEPAEQSSLVPHRSSTIAQEERLRQTGVRPYSSLLSTDDLDDCDWLEHAAFDPIEAATREKVRAILHAPLGVHMSSALSALTGVFCVAVTPDPWR